MSSEANLSPSLSKSVSITTSDEGFEIIFSKISSIGFPEISITFVKPSIFKTSPSLAPSTITIGCSFLASSTISKNWGESIII